MFGMKARKTAAKWKDSEPQVPDVKVDAVDTGESFRAEKPEAPKAKKQSFKEAFASAKDGSTFSWDGKQYKKEYAKTNRPGSRGPLTRASTGPDSKKSTSPAAKAASVASDFIRSGGGPAAGAAAAGRYMTRGGGSAPSGAGGLGFEGLKARRDDFYGKLKANREAKGMKDQPAPDLTPGQIPALKARSDDFYAKLKANREAKGMANGGSVGKYSKMEKEHVAQMKKHGVPEKYIKEEEKEAKGMKCGGKVMKYAKGGGVESKGKTQGKMIRMASGGSVSARADGIASRGKTNCKIC